MSRHNPALQEKMFDLVRQQVDGSETVKAFCERHDLSVASFNYWLRKRRSIEAKNEGDFVRIEVAGPESSPKFELVLGDGKRILFYQEMSPAFIKSLL